MENILIEINCLGKFRMLKYKSIEVNKCVQDVLDASRENEFKR